MIFACLLVADDCGGTAKTTDKLCRHYPMLTTAYLNISGGYPSLIQYLVAMHMIVPTKLPMHMS